MKFFSPYNNIFFYYRGLSMHMPGEGDRQIEDNTTKALINTLELSHKELLRALLKALNIPHETTDEIKFELQVAKDDSRPDAAIVIGDLEVLIESKVHISLSPDQILNHLKAVEKGFVVCITNRESDISIVRNLKKDNLRFISWLEIYCLFRKSLNSATDQISSFMIKQFLEYLEIINMAPFTGWNKKDFEAFLRIEDDPKRELRLRVKNKLSQFTKDLHVSLEKSKVIKDHELYIINVHKNSDEICGVIARPPVTKRINIPHYNFILDSDAFSLAIQIEGVAPTRKVFKKIQNEKSRVLKMLQQLEGYVFIIRSRTELAPHKWQSKVLATISINKNMTMDDIEYIIKKSTQCDYFEYRIAKFYKRDEPILDNDDFFNEAVRRVKQLRAFYDFVSDK